MEMKMPLVKQCSVANCAYNTRNACHAMAITVGDPGGEPACDTFFQSARHGGVKDAIAGVGACKTDLCKFNRDYECSAPEIQVGLLHDHPDCMTFQKN